MASSAEPFVRDARSNERDAIRDLTLSAYSQYATRMEPSAWSSLRAAIVAILGSDHHAEQIVAEKDGRLVGSVLLFPQATDAYPGLGHRAQWPEIRLLAVAPEVRGLGVAKLLVNECIRRARSTGAEAIGLHTSRSMLEAIHLYERAGFMRDPGGDMHVDGAEPIEAYRLTLPVT